MAAIITITLNPAIDKSVSVPAVVAEKKLRCTKPVFEPGGGGVNVARALKKLGSNAVAIYLGGGYTGKFFKQLLDKESVNSTVIEIAGHTRENLIVLDDSSSQQYRFGMPGPEVSENEWRQLLTAIEKAAGAEMIVASGSVPAGVPPDIFARIGDIAKRKKAKFIVDTSGEPLKLAAAGGVYLLKPNMRELGSLVENEELTTDMAAGAAKELVAKGQCEVMVVSMGAAGALLVTREEQYVVKPPHVLIKSTVGAGDSMVAGMVLGLSNNKTMLEVLQYGVACGTAATMNPGTALCRPEDASFLYDQLRQVRHQYHDDSMRVKTG